MRLSPAICLYAETLIRANEKGGKLQLLPEKKNSVNQKAEFTKIAPGQNSNDIVGRCNKMALKRFHSRDFIVITLDFEY